MRKQREITIKIIKNKSSNNRILIEFFARKFNEKEYQKS